MKTNGKGEVIEMSANATVLIILQYENVPNQQIVHLKIKQCHMLIIP